VFGIDVSMGMLRQGATSVAKGHIRNVHFAHAKAEALSFEDNVPDAVICCGSLHLFADTTIALPETARLMRSRVQGVFASSRLATRCSASA
jgi:ubiquinone/menaquinone biosynthesis C-methylase UbiE